MNTTNTPDREEVIAEVKEWISNGKATLVGLDRSASQTKHMKARLELLSSALQLLEQDREDGKDRARLDFADSMTGGEWGIVGELTWGCGTEHKTCRAAIDSAMAATTEKGEG